MYDISTGQTANAVDTGFSSFIFNYLYTLLDIVNILIKTFSKMEYVHKHRRLTANESMLVLPGDSVHLFGTVSGSMVA